MSLSGSSNAEKIWNYLYSKIGNAYGTAGLEGNLYAESGLKPKNLQNSYESKLGYTDATYTKAVDNGTYVYFASDSAGYGLAQWTYSTRKAALLAYAVNKSKSVGDLETQLEFLIKELKESYASVWKTLQNAESVEEASNAVLLKFEKPANTSTTIQTKRANYGQNYFDKYASEEAETEDNFSSTDANTVTASNKAQKKNATYAGTYTTTANLHLRDGAGTSHTSLKVIPKGTAVKNYGFYSLDSSKQVWLYIQVTISGTKYTGFSLKKYLNK